MPIYEYQCEDCGHRLEAMQKMNDAPLRDCPQCGRPGLRKRVSAAGFQLKGGGWYVTDFRDKGKKKGDGKGAAGSEAKGEHEAKGGGAAPAKAADSAKE